METETRMSLIRYPFSQSKYQTFLIKETNMDTATALEQTAEVYSPQKIHTKRNC